MLFLRIFLISIITFTFGYAVLSKILLTEVDRLIKETEDKNSVKYKEMVSLKEKESLSPKHLINVTKTVFKWEKIDKNLKNNTY